MEKRFVYADNAATTPVSERVLKAMLPFLTDKFGNPSGMYSFAREARRAVEEAREKIASSLGCEAREIYFTSGGTEADNWAVLSAAASGKKHIVTSAIEHPAVLSSCRHLEKLGFEVTYLLPDGYGFISPAQVSDAIRDDTALVSVMYANNETGAVQPVPEIGMICREKGALFHTDAVQAVGNIPIDLKSLNADMLSLSGHKLRAPKGIGALYVRSGIDIDPILFGGGQEKGKRPGTENVPAAVASGEAVLAACEDIPAKASKTASLRERIIKGLSRIERSRLNGSRENSLPGIINMSFERVESSSLVLMLDPYGICASGGSACSSLSGEPSHVLLAMGLDAETASGALRLSISEETTEEDAEYIISSVTEAVARLRKQREL